MKTLERLAGRFRRSPLLRFAIRAALAGAAGYVGDAVRIGAALSWHAAAAAAISSCVYAVAGYFTPAEPSVGPAATKIPLDPVK